MNDIICPKCGEQMLKDKILTNRIVYADRLWCFKCGYWETRALPIPRLREEGDYGIELDGLGILDARFMTLLKGDKK